MVKPRLRYKVRTITLRMRGREQIFTIADLDQRRCVGDPLRPGQCLSYGTKAEALESCARLNGEEARRCQNPD